MPFVLGQTQYDMSVSLVVEAGETLHKAYLSTWYSEHAGWVQAKRAADSEYMEILGLLDPNCFLGTLVGPQTIEIDLRIELPADVTAGLTSVVIFAASLEGVSEPNECFSSDEDAFPLWGEDEETEVPLWSDA